MNLLMSWIFFGTAIGFTTHFLQVNPSGKPLYSAVLLGIFGAVLGGVLGHYLNNFILHAYISPSLAMVIGATFTSLLPTKEERKEDEKYAIH